MVYAGFTQTLNINGTGNVVASKWDIYIANLSNAVTITDYDNSCPKEVIIPSTIEDKPVTTIGNNAFNNKQLTSVIIKTKTSSRQFRELILGVGHQV